MKYFAAFTAAAILLYLSSSEDESPFLPQNLAAPNRVESEPVAEETPKVPTDQSLINTLDPAKKRGVKKRSSNKRGEKYRSALARKGIASHDYKGWFEHGEPVAIHFREQGELEVIEGDFQAGVGSGVGRILNISDTQSAADMARDRNRDFAHNYHNPSNFLSEEIQKLRSLDLKSFRLSSLS
ncbi:MAG: hypothetical protein AAF202_13670, partial [Pseudomonadota bacterium]